MRLFNWAESFKETPTCDDILKRVRRTEIQYWIWLVISIGIMGSGLNMIHVAPSGDIKQHVLGLFWAILGLVCAAIIKIWVHIRLTTYFIIWDRNNTIEAEINKMETQDL